MVYLGHLKDVLVAGLGDGGGGEPGAELLPPVGEPLEAELLSSTSPGTWWRLLQ